MAKDRSQMTQEELIAEIREADEEQRTAADGVTHEDEARWTPGS